MNLLSNISRYIEAGLTWQCCGSATYLSFGSVSETFQDALFGVLFGVQKKIVIGYRIVRLNFWLIPGYIRQEIFRPDP